MFLGLGIIMFVFMVMGDGVLDLVDDVRHGGYLMFVDWYIENRFHSDNTVCLGVIYYVSPE